MHRLFAFTLLLTGSALTQAAQQPTEVDRLASSLKFPPGSYEPADRVSALDVQLLPGSLQLKDPGALNAKTATSGFVDLPAGYGLRCQTRNVYASPAVPDDFWELREKLLDLPGSVGLNETNGLLLFRRGDVFGWLTWRGTALFLGTCTVGSEVGAAETLAPFIGIHQGSAPVALMADVNGTLAWCGAEGMVRQRRLTRGGLREISVSWDGKLIAMAGWDPHPVILIVDAATGEVRRSIDRPHGVEVLAFSGDGLTLLARDVNSTFALLDVRSGQVLNEWDNEAWGKHRLLGGGATSFIQTNTGNGPIRVIDAATGKMTRNLRSYQVAASALTLDGVWAVTAERQGQLEAYRSQDVNLGFPRTPDAAVLLGVSGPAVLLPGRAAEEVLAVVKTAATGGTSAVQAFAWRVGERAVTPLNTVQVGARNLLTVNRDTGTLAAVPACLPGR